ncbi:MAG: DUF1156 domain-containing protein, partial [Planctomycetaceae bacterium]|nr:DUF1156 domain-containing protein [Planctomycetaceae bacterium]
RLGLRAYASDLNPVPVLINKALIEIPPKFAGMPPVNPKAQKGKLKTKVWNGARGLADDVRYYGQWMRDEAEKRIGHLYPKVKVTEEMAADRPDLKPYVGKELTVIAWLWARTVESPDPSLHGRHVPLIRSYWLSKKKRNEAYIRPTINQSAKGYEFSLYFGKPQDAFDPEDGTVKRSGGSCLLSGSPIPFTHIRDAGKANELGTDLMACVCQAGRTRVFIPPMHDQTNAARVQPPNDGPSATISHWPGRTNVVEYGMEHFEDLFTNRQLHAMVTFSDLAREVDKKIQADAINSLNFENSNAYASAVATFLAFAVDRTANTLCTVARWAPDRCQTLTAFARQALPMTWDFPEVNPFANAAGDIGVSIESIVEAIQRLPASGIGIANQASATESLAYDNTPVISTDPPYYDNICYADLSDFFYMWMRRSLHDIYPKLLSTMQTPKSEELIASPYRHGGNRSKAAAFFEEGLGVATGLWRHHGAQAFPTTIFYAFKQAETDSAGTASTGWETFLAGVIRHGYAITATWPLRSELGNRPIASGSNALASSIVLACVPRTEDATLATRRDFANALRQELPEAIKHLQSGNVAPVDLAQASIGPGMAVFSRYKQVVNADGSPMSVREALQMINQVLDEALSEQEADFDSETRFAVRWYEQYGENDGPFGDAETLAKAMAVAVSGVVEAGILASKAGKVRLLKRDQLDANWNPATDKRSTIWECTQHLIRRLEEDGESASAQLLADIQQAKGSEAGEVARELSYRLYSTCERKSRAAEARSYNGLVVSWPEISRMARDLKNRPAREAQREMFE